VRFKKRFIAKKQIFEVHPYERKSIRDYKLIMKSLRILVIVLAACILAFFFRDHFFKSSAPQTPKKTICLNMIVKNERDVITRCFDSVLPIIDYWVVVDTGSTDGTQKIIKDYMKKNNIPGELHERPWVNFSHNRNEAMDLAKDKADYLFLIDADEYLLYEPDFTLPSLDKDCYYVTIVSGGTKLSKLQLLNNHLDWKFTGVLHEVIDPGARSSSNLEKVVNIYTNDGARSKDPRKYEKDAEVFEKALLDEPENSRYVFYLARSYQGANNRQLALKNYEKRATMGGWNEELYWALLQVGILQEELNMPPETFISSYRRAYQFRPSRIEALYYLANYFQRTKNYESGYATAKLAMTIPPSSDMLFVQQWMHDYGIPLEYSICAYWIDKFEECEETSLALLKRNDLPPHFRECITNNLGFARGKILERICEKNIATTSEPKESE